ncbi:MAG: EAL domain-containing protein [Synechococcaceae cyanobacterium RL_1_2]|nr:EAL domain-containing protein [Synechococcaceae cyanobacterium RL_1_2]
MLDLQNKAQLQLEADLRHAIEREQLEVVYQPQVDLFTGDVICAEALIRWHHPHRGDIPPGKFIPIAEETGLIEPIGNWILEQACLQLKKWHSKGWHKLKLSINLSARQFNQRDICNKLVSIFKNAAVKTDCIELEITESTLVQHPAFAVRKLRQLAEMGIKVAIDDFGTGYSSLAYLQQFPFHILKIDRSFIHQIDRNDRNEAITKAIIELAHNLNLTVVGEGVETEQELKILKRFDCDVIQGYLFSPPLKARSFEHLLESDQTLARLAQLKL